MKEDEELPTLTQQDISNIDEISHELLEKFWKILEFVEKRKQQGREDNMRIVAAAGNPILDLGGLLAFGLNNFSISLTTLAVNSGIIAANRNKRFEFNTQRDSRVCPICEPKDRIIMSEEKTI